MVIVCLYDEINGYRYRKISMSYYDQVANFTIIVEAWIVPGTHND